MKRLFIAFPITLDKEFVALTDQLKAGMRNDSIVWTESQVQHLTLRFLGETPEPQIPVLIDALTDALRDVTASEVAIDKLGVFGSHYHPTTLWLGFNDFGPLKRLHEYIEPAVEAAGFEPYQGNFVPHITLGRVKNVLNKNKFWETFNQCQPTHQQIVDISRIVLYQSKLHSDGPVYRELKSWKLL